jgi:hypothetical protein
LRTITKAVALLLSIVLLSSGTLAQTDGEKNAAKVRAKLEAIFNDGDVAKIELQDGRKVQGHVSELNSDHFILSDFGRVNSYEYAEVKRVGRIGRSRSAKIWVPIAFLGGLIGLLLGLASQTD